MNTILNFFLSLCLCATVDKRYWDSRHDKILPQITTPLISSEMHNPVVLFQELKVLLDKYIENAHTDFVYTSYMHNPYIQSIADKKGRGRVDLNQINKDAARATMQLTPFDMKMFPFYPEDYYDVREDLKYEQNTAKLYSDFRKYTKIEILPDQKRVFALKNSLRSLLLNIVGHFHRDMSIHEPDDKTTEHVFYTQGMDRVLLFFYILFKNDHQPFPKTRACRAMIKFLSEKSNIFSGARNIDVLSKPGFILSLCNRNMPMPFEINRKLVPVAISEHIYELGICSLGTQAGILFLIAGKNFQYLALQAWIAFLKYANGGFYEYSVLEHVADRLCKDSNLLPFKENLPNVLLNGGLERFDVIRFIKINRRKLRPIDSMYLLLASTFCTISETFTQVGGEDDPRAEFFQSLMNNHGFDFEDLSKSAVSRDLYKKRYSLSGRVRRMTGLVR